MNFFQKCSVVVSVLEKLSSVNLKNHMLPCEHLCLDNKIGFFGNSKAIFYLCTKTVNFNNF